MLVFSHIHLTIFYFTSPHQRNVLLFISSPNTVGKVIVLLSASVYWTEAQPSIQWKGCRSVQVESPVFAVLCRLTCLEKCLFQKLWLLYQQWVPKVMVHWLLEVLSLYIGSRFLGFDSQPSRHFTNVRDSPGEISIFDGSVTQNVNFFCVSPAFTRIRRT